MDRLTVNLKKLIRFSGKIKVNQNFAPMGTSDQVEMFRKGLAMFSTFFGTSCDSILHKIITSGVYKGHIMAPECMILANFIINTIFE